MGFTCTSCRKGISRHCDYLECSGLCGGRLHLLCAGIDEAKFIQMRDNSQTKTWKCVKCAAPPEARQRSSSVDVPHSSNSGFSSKSESGLSTCDRCSAIIDHFSAVMKQMELKMIAEMTTFKKQLIDEMKAILVPNFCSMQDKLSEQIRKDSQGSSVRSGTSFSQVAAGKPAVIIMPKADNQTSAATKSDLLQSVNPVDLGVMVSRVKHTRGGGLVVGCSSGDSADKLKREIDTKLADKYTVKSLRPVKPRMKVVGMTERHENDTFLNFLKVQNESVFKEDSTLRVLSFEAIRAKKGGNSQIRGDTVNRGRRQIYQSVLEIDLNTYNAAVSSGQVFVGYDCCAVYDAVDLIRCFNCSGFNHTSKNCKFKLSCPKCSGSHAITDCNTETLKCVNCCASRDFEANCGHAAWDKICPIYQQKLKVFRTDVLGLE